ncbi:hypothetical protein BDD12DRAFT_802790 [Trichophaea hybrida]|nr:hypothetical protein BDD12DRAFT_802790 [Trichophaea hybrida]
MPCGTQAPLSVVFLTIRLSALALSLSSISMASMTLMMMKCLDLMANAQRCFHDSKTVLQQFTAGKHLAAEAKERCTELCAEQDTELNWEDNKKQTAAFRQRIHNAWNGIIDAEMAKYIEDGSDFNFPKIHLMQNFREQIQ